MDGPFAQPQRLPIEVAPFEAREAATPSLTEDELAAAEGVGTRLRAEFGRLVRWLPKEAKSVRGMSAFLSTDRNICQRVQSALRPGLTGANAVLKLPGLRPMGELVEEAKKAGAPGDVVASLVAALSQLEALAASAGGSQAKLKARLEAALASVQVLAVGDGQMDALSVRRAHFMNSARMLGRHMRLASSVTAVRPHPDAHDKVEQAWVQSLVGLQMEPNAAPAPLGFGTTDHLRTGQAAGTFSPLSSQTKPYLPSAGIVEALSSSSVAPTSRGPSGRLVITVDSIGARRSTDISIATRLSHIEHPTLKPPEVFHTSQMVLNPVTRMVFDFYVHRTLAMKSVPGAGMFIYTMSFGDDMEDNWPFRLPVQCRLELLGSSPEDAASDAWQKHELAAAHLFEQTGWKRVDFVGHRLNIEYPIWGAAVFQWLDFRSPIAST